LKRIHSSPTNVICEDVTRTAFTAAIQELSKQTQRHAEALRDRETRIAELEEKATRLSMIERELADMKKLLARLAEPCADEPSAGEPVISQVGASPQ
jgi:hypothetical protein